ncbi:MAG: aminotransferase class I/II-fold pyridoxal phosphate-dependent enzyme [Treponema sp.]|jgi:aspartate/methionine/tyrosine aminotransferase|nr:aminotransferase class I/II-fold pyridoxal phosphate-dependent enzyme [Treponema sp.]
MDPLAVELNGLLDGSVAGSLLSSLGRRLFFPRGIIAQAAEAKKTARINATLGMAFREGKPLVFSALARQVSGLKPEEAVVYAPTAGVEGFRRAWKESLLQKNPSLGEDDFSLPVVVPGITAGISYVADLFLDEGQTVLAGDPSWDNYSLIFTERRGALIKGIPLFDSSHGEGGGVPVRQGGNPPEGRGLNLAAFEKALEETEAAASGGGLRIILNFPQNPSGYTPTLAEADALVRMAARLADRGVSVLVICDDAYFGLFYEAGTIRESLFSRFAVLHEKVLAVKVDGPTKEDYVWGLRSAFVSFGSKGLDGAAYGALEKKLMGAIRSSVSCANTPAQYLTLKTMKDPATAKERELFFDLLRNRYRRVKRFLEEHPAPPVLEALPFNSGYFMSFRCGDSRGRGMAEELRQALLKKGIGTIALGDTYLRVTFAAIEEEEIPQVFGAIYETAGELG